MKTKIWKMRVKNGLKYGCMTEWWMLISDPEEYCTVFGSWDAAMQCAHPTGYRSTSGLTAKEFERVSCHCLEE